MLALTWNINAKSGAAPSRLHEIVSRIASKEPDVVLLQEVGNGVADDLLRELKKAGLPGFFGGGSCTEGKTYGNLIASRWPIEPVSPGWSTAPWPQLLTRATVKVADVPIDVIAAHMPNGSGNGWRKIDTFDALSKALAVSPKMPRILGGDFNEPWLFLPNGDLVSFGADRNRDPSRWFQGNRTGPKIDGRLGESRPRTEWNEAVRAVLGWGAPHGLRHVHHVAHGFDVPAVTHVVRGEDRFFDHLLVSANLVVEDSGFFHDWRIGGVSDHSAAWAKITPLPR